MISPCQYTIPHPENQKVTHLERHGNGRLFPHNPEFYDLASGLYGPGSYCCWHFLIVSVFANWAFTPRDEHRVKRPGISADLLAMVTSSSFAATDVLVQTLSPWGSPDRALAVFCLRFPAVDLDLYGLNDTELDFGNVPPEVLSLGQHAVSITGPLTICYTFSTALLALILTATDSFILDIRPTRWARRLLYAAYGYLCFSLAVFHLSLWDLGINGVMILYQSLMPVPFVMIFGLAVAVGVGLVIGLGMLVVAIANRRMTAAVGILKGLAGGLLAAAMIAVSVADIFTNGFTLIPDLGIRLVERDQLAALIVGIASLAMTLYHIWTRWKATIVKSGGGFVDEVRRFVSHVKA